MSENILLVKENQIAVVTLNRPNAGNAISLDLVKELFAIALELSHDNEVRVVVLKGSGKHFSFGGDLKSFADQGPTIDLHLKEVTSYLHQIISLFSRMKKLVVAVVNGTAAGAGLSLLCACDLVLASKTAKFTPAYTKVGLTPDGSCTYFLPRLIGLRKTQELLYTNRVLSAEEAYNWGILTAIFEEGIFEEESQKVINMIAEGPVGAFGATKRLLNRSFLDELDSHMALESDFISESIISTEGKEGIRSFLEKRKPKFI